MVIEDLLQNLVFKHKDLWKEFIASKDMIFFYSGHIPLSAIILTHGNAYLLGRDRKHLEMPPNEVHFIKELINENPLKRNFHLKKGTKILLIDRYTLLKLHTP